MIDLDKVFPAPHRCPYCGKTWKRQRVYRWDAARQEYRETGEYASRSRGHSVRLKHMRKCGSDFGARQTSLSRWCSRSEKL